jgi:hypothetical protein
VTGGPATGTVTFKDGITVLGTGTLASGTATFATSTLAMGAHSITASYGGDATFATSVSSTFTFTVNLLSYESWASDAAQGLTAGVNDGPSQDPDHDGIPNLLEFALGGNPMVSLRSILPALTKSNGPWVFEYERNGLSMAATTQVVEYGSDLTGWTAVTIPATSSGIVTITPGGTTDHVKVILPTLGTKGFVRLKVSQ